MLESKILKTGWDIFLIERTFGSDWVFVFRNRIGRKTTILEDIRLVNEIISKVAVILNHLRE